MGKGLQHGMPNSRIAESSFELPCVPPADMSTDQHLVPICYRSFFRPSSNCVFFESDEDAFSVHLEGRHPTWFATTEARHRRTIIRIIGFLRRFDAGKADEGVYLFQTL